MKKCVIVVNKDLPLGLKANISAILCMSLGKSHPEIIGLDLSDADNITYKGITTIPVPILETYTDNLKAAKKIADLTVEFSVAFNCSALSTKDYAAYETSLRSKRSTDVLIHGLLMYGSKVEINKIAANFPLMR
ncbi:DUF2000 domain-containing protein [Caballeronia sp.]|uniref:DUF2000 domain-containing protein n=1 Tax=Caballeronia sp. TaxID=1931223 RepID=UPI003C34BDCE